MTTTFPDALTTWDETAELKGRSTLAEFESAVVLDMTLLDPAAPWNPLTNPLRPEFIRPDRRQSVRPVCESCGVQHDYTGLLAAMGGAS